MARIVQLDKKRFVSQPQQGSATTAATVSSTQTWVNETPAGTINGTNTTFTLTYLPKSGTTVLIFQNGLFQIPAVDYVLSGKTITLTTAPPIGADLAATYQPT